MAICVVITRKHLFRLSLSADVSNTIYGVAKASRGLSVCEKKQDRFVFFYSLEEGNRVL